MVFLPLLLCVFTQGALSFKLPEFIVEEPLVVLGASSVSSGLSRRDVLVLGGGALLATAKVAAIDGKNYKVTADLTGKTVLITGGNTGLGLESAIRLANAGAQVYLVKRLSFTPVYPRFAGDCHLP